MRIGIDVHFVGVRSGGNEIYFENLLTQVARLARDGDEYFAFSCANAARMRLATENLQLLPLHGRSVYWQRAVEIPRYARQLDLDVLHVPFNFVPAGRCKKIVSIHDLGFLHMPEAYAPAERLRMRWLTRSAARRADHVLTLSDYWKRSIVESYDLPASMVTVAPAAVDSGTFRVLDEAAVRRERDRLGLACDYVLAVGEIQRRKNLRVLLEAIGRVREETRREVHVALVGRKGRGADEVLRYVAESGLGKCVHFVGSVGTEALVALYNGALALVYPSLLEGFGMPILEGMSCGCPVICSNAAAMPEVYGDAALPFDPREPDDLAAQLRRVVDDGALRSDLVRRGFANARRFSWERTAAIVDRVYRA